MDRNRKRVTYVAGGAAGRRAMAYGMQSSGKKKKKGSALDSLKLIVPVVLTAALIVFVIVWSLTHTGRSGIGRATRIGATLSQNITPFGESVIFYDGTTLHCMNAGGGNEWSYQIGTNADYDANEDRVVAWSGNDIYILNSRGTRGRRESLVIEPCRVAVEFEETRAAASHLLGSAVVRELHSGTLCEEGDSVRKREVFDLHDEVDDAAALAAAEAVVDLLVRRHGEGGRLFAVERAQPEQVRAAALGQTHILAHHVHDVVALGELVQKSFRYGQKSPSFLRRRGLRIIRPDRKRQGSLTPSLLLLLTHPLRWAA